MTKAEIKNMAAFAQKSGYKVAINKCGSVMQISDRNNILQIEDDGIHSTAFLLFKEKGYYLGEVDISSYMEKNFIENLLKTPDWAKEDIAKQLRFANLDDLINQENERVESLKFEKL